ncbi:ribose-5-phosphate isomerase [Hypnocyclicus thermotrophus]|uniref:Ribose-5-phosphate isomerase n=1 Tax=Hypnocyclicus thermotrophus TaxID=1627895 RepID=A0AA46I6B2_9FUSO|nr:ribose 5-phosphate isomerase B [Hypnocyclicus thermotrophus]TDT71970.1 ribose-5-phosphate isomerase [Hypnocyclicus thermotrophus]
MKKIALGADHGGYELKNIVREYLKNNGYEVIDFGTNSSDSVDYPEFAHKVGEAVVNKEADFGIVVCGTGIGISIAANKIKGVRAALCHNVWTAKLTRQHNDANVLAMGGRVIGPGIALDMVEAFLNTEFEGGRHTNRVNKIEEC